MSDDWFGALSVVIILVSVLALGCIGGRSLEKFIGTACTESIRAARTARDTSLVAVKDPQCQWYVDEAQGDHRQPAEAK